MNSGPWIASATRGIVALVLICAFVSPASAFDASKVEEVELDNGARVLLWHDDTIPNLAVYTFWKVGSRNEAPGITGLAHFFEHMMFNGSENFAPGEFDRTMEAAGGANNAARSRIESTVTASFQRSRTVIEAPGCMYDGQDLAHRKRG